MAPGPAWLWDQHTCLPLQPGADVGPLTRFLRPGRGGFVSVNVGYSPHSTADAVALLDAFRAAVEAHPQLTLGGTVEAIDTAVAAGRIAVAFDLEDSGPLDGDLDAVHRFAALGVRTLLPTYNHANAAGSGCLDATDTGLTAWGRALVGELNAAGVARGAARPSGSTAADRPQGRPPCSSAAGWPPAGPGRSAERPLRWERPEPCLRSSTTVGQHCC